MMRLLYNICGTLLEIDPNTFGIVPGLAESFARIDDWTATPHDPEQARAVLAESDYNGETIVYHT